LRKMSHTPDKTCWPDVFVFLTAGIAVALLIGKVPGALPVMRVELGLTLFEAGLMVSVYSLIAALGGVTTGAMAARFGSRKIAIIGMVMAALGSLAGSYATSSVPLLATRTIEGLGFFMTAVSMPTLMIRASRFRDRQKVLGIWASYMPAGMGIMLLTGALLVERVGWSGVWQIVAGVIFVVGLGVAITAKRYPAVEADKTKPVTLVEAISVLTLPGPLLLAVTFGAYGAQFLIIVAFVPLILVEQGGWSVVAAGMAGAGVIFANIIGTIASGWILGHHVSRAQLVISTSLILAVCASVVLSDQLSPVLRLTAAVAFSTFGGLIPGAMFAGTPVHAPTPRHISSVNGLMLQGVAIGQLVGPTLSSFIVEKTGQWSSALFVIYPLAVLAIIAGLKIAKLEKSI